MGVSVVAAEVAVTASVGVVTVVVIQWQTRFVLFLFSLNHINAPVQHMWAILGQTEAC